MLLSTIKRIENEAFKVGGVISLAQGVPAFPSHELIKKKVINEIQKGTVDHYSLSAGLPVLRDYILDKFDLNLSRDEVIVTAGAMQALSAIFLSYLHEGDEVITFSPYYSTYAQSVGLSHATLVCEPLKIENKWRPDIESFKSKINSKTKIILLCNPHNPTGVVFTEDELEKIIQIALKHNLLIVSDEVYRNFYYEKESVYCLRHKANLENNLITVMSLSKDFSLSGWRVGFLFGSKKLLENIYPIHDALVNCAPVVSQYAALAAFDHEKEILQRTLPQYAEHRKLMNDSLKSLQTYVDFVCPEGSYYFFIRIKGLKDSEQFCFDMIRKEKVAVIPGTAFGKDFEGYIRLCFGRSKEDIIEGMKRFNKYVLEWISLNNLEML